jgi:ABC-type spermidine/putrescine transport system permease subunit I
VRVVVPNVRSAVLSASFLSVALVLGEFTMASLLNFDNLQVAINLLGKRDAERLRGRVAGSAALRVRSCSCSPSSSAGRRRAGKEITPGGS